MERIFNLFLLYSPSGSIPEEKTVLSPHNEVVSDSCGEDPEHSYDEDDAHILSPLLDESGPQRPVQFIKKNGSRPNSGKRDNASTGAASASSPSAEKRPMSAGGPNSKSKAITIGNGRASFSHSPSATLLMGGGDRNGNGSVGGSSTGSGEDPRRRRLRKMTVGSSSSSQSSNSSGSDNEGHGDAFDANIKFS